MRMGKIHAPVQRTGVYLDSLAVIYDLPEYSLKDLHIVLHIKMLCLRGAITKDIVQVTVNGVILKMPDDIKDLLKIPAITAFFSPFLKIWRIVRIKSIHHMGGADDKIQLRVTL